MTTFNRKTEFWKLSTPNKVGPGSYNLVSEPELKPAAAPFSTGVIREDTRRKSEIGPGSYIKLDSWDSPARGAAMMSSGSPRMGPFATGITGFTMPTNVYNPGPGTYLTELNNKKKYSKSARRHSLTIDPSPASIPFKEIKPSEVSPVAYNPEYGQVKPIATSTTFGGYLSKRKVFPGNEENPGPGEYTSDQSKGVSHAFTKAAKTDRNKNTNPGPGTYELPIDRKVRKEIVEAFGVMEKKHIMFSKDPHRPIQVGYSENPPVGIYETDEKLKNTEKLKQKFISYEAPIAKPPFNVSTKRQMKWVDNPTFPGPGTYSDQQSNLDTNEKVPFNSKEEKFHKLSSMNIPGPGSYEKEKSKGSTKASSVFMSKTPRFSKVASDNLSVAVVGSQPNLEFDLSHRDWRAKQSRAFDATLLKPNLSFESTANRFFAHKKDPNNPGPGYYESRPVSVPSKTKRTGQRFGVFENYRPKTGTAQNVGPGSYSVDIGKKKSFNMSGELVKVRPWIS